MARIAVLDDYPVGLGALVASLEAHGHHVLGELAPVDFEAVIQFKPKVLVVGLARRSEAYDRPLEDLDRDVLGYQALTALGGQPALHSLPIVVVGVGLKERELRLPVPAVYFLTFPDDMEVFPAKVAELAKRKQTRYISDFKCPKLSCGGRLMYFKQPIKDLFCPKCGSSVALIDDEHGVWMCPEGRQHACTVEELRVTGRNG